MIVFACTQQISASDKKSQIFLRTVNRGKEAKNLATVLISFLKNKYLLEFKLNDVIGSN